LVQAKLDLVGLGAFAHRHPEEISTDMRMRAAIARALMLEPELLFLEERSLGLYPIQSVELDKLIKRISNDHRLTVVIVTHEPANLFRIVDHCIILDRAAKGIVAQGDPRMLRDTSDIPFVRDLFGALPDLGAGSQGSRNQE
jgi:phospholipid/cholesterol/gamma-HCH transport system ATP-binding protein